MTSMARTFAAVALTFACIQPVASAAENVAASADQVRPLLIGATVPAATLMTADGKTFDLGESLSKQMTVVVFYRGGW